MLTAYEGTHWAMGQCAPHSHTGTGVRDKAFHKNTAQLAVARGENEVLRQRLIPALGLDMLGCLIRGGIAPSMDEITAGWGQGLWREASHPYRASHPPLETPPHK